MCCSKESDRRPIAAGRFCHETSRALWDIRNYHAAGKMQPHLRQGAEGSWANALSICQFRSYAQHANVHKKEHLLGISPFFVLHPLPKFQLLSILHFILTCFQAHSIIPTRPSAGRQK